MVLQLRPRSFNVERGSRGFGLSLIYRGLDKYDERDTGIFVARVVPGGQAARFGVRENDKIVTINGKSPRNVDDAVSIIKSAGNGIKLVVLREEDMPDITIDDTSSLMSQDMDAKWMAGAISGQTPMSRSGSARSFNTIFGRSGVSTPSPRSARANLGAESPSPYPRNLNNSHHEQRRQQDIAEEAQRRQRQMMDNQYRSHNDSFSSSNVIKDQVMDILSKKDLGYERSKSVDSARRVVEETKKSMENIIKVVETGIPNSNKYKSTHSLHELGLDNYPNPEMPDGPRLTRKEEKMSLQNLNNRLAGYIDRVRQLQQENTKLSRQIRTVEDYQSKEISNVKDLYDKQTQELKDTIEHMNKQHNQLKVGAEGLLQENQDLKDRLEKRENDLKNSADHIVSLEDEIRGLGNKMSEMDRDRRRLQERLEEVVPEAMSLGDRLADVKRQLDNEQLRSADLESKNARLEEDLKFKLQLLEKELKEVKTRKETEITEMDGKLQEEYEDRLRKALQELRDIYDQQMAQSREDFAKLYDNRVSDLQSHLSEERGNNTSREQELKETKSRLESLNKKVTELDNANLALKQKNSNLEQRIEDLKSANKAHLAAKDDEIRRLLDELSTQLHEYQNLQDIKVALDMEIQVFRSLIECEEDRLGLSEQDETTPVSTSSSNRAYNSYIDPMGNEKTSIERTNESSFQRKVTISQTQL